MERVEKPHPKTFPIEINFRDFEKDPINFERFATFGDWDTLHRHMALWKSDSADMEVVVGDTVFKVHKTLLAIASGFFHKDLSNARPYEGMRRMIFPSIFRVWEVETCLKDAYHLFDNNMDDHMTAITASTDFARLSYCADALEFTSLCFDAPKYFLLSLKNPALHDNPGILTETIKEVYSGIGGRVYLGKEMAKALKAQGLLKVIPGLGALFAKFPQFAVDMATALMADEKEGEATSSDSSSNPDCSEQADKGEKVEKGESAKKPKGEDHGEKGETTKKATMEEQAETGEKAKKAKKGEQGEKGEKAKKGGA